MSVKRFFKTAIFSVLALAAVLVANFFLPRLMPGDPLGHLIGADDVGAISQEQYDEYYKMLNLDKPMGEQFAQYLKEIFSGKMGYSIHYGRDVADVIGEKLPRTLQVALPAWIISALLAFFWGTLAGYKKHRAFDRISTGAMVAADTVPTFLMAMLLLIVFSYELGWFPFGALNSAADLDGASMFADRLYHLVLPVLTLVIASTPKKFILMRNVTAKAVGEKYIIYAKARGLSDMNVLCRHVFPNVGQPFISMLGTSFGKILSGSIVVEMIFSIDGMGMLVSRGITDMDFPVLQAALMTIAFAVIISNLAADAICILLDPMQRSEEGA